MELHVVSWNLWGAPLSPDPEPRMAAVARWIEGTAPDLVLLQEVFSDDQTRAIEDVLGGRYETFEAAPTRALIGRKGGLVAFLRRDPAPAWELDSQRFVEFEAEAFDGIFWQGDGIADKGVQRIALRHGESSLPLLVLNTHLQAPYSPGFLFDYEGVRRAQVAQLEEVARSAEGPVIAAGDLNLRPDSENYRRLRGFWDDLTGAVRERCGCGTNNPDADGSADWIDYVLGRGTEAWRVAAEVRRLARTSPDGAPLSDHNGLEARITIAARPRASLRSLAPAALLAPTSRREWLVATALSAGTWLLPGGSRDDLPE